jgi:hypothetical protein
MPQLPAKQTKRRKNKFVPATFLIDNWKNLSCFTVLVSGCVAFGKLHVRVGLVLSCLVLFF